MYAFKRTYDDMIVRFNKNYIAEKSFSEEIKSRKFNILQESGFYCNKL